MFTIKQVDTYWQYLQVKDELESSISELHKSGDYIQGALSREFELEFARYLGVPEFIGVGNGTDALEIILKGLNLPSGLEVIIPNMTFFATYESVINAGGTPKLIDVNENGVMESGDVEAAISDRTFAVIAVHLTGYPCNVQAIHEVCKKHSINLIEDACQAHNTFINKKPPGHFSDAAAFSFYPGKNLGGIGDSGGIATLNQSLAKNIRQLRDHGRVSKYEHMQVGRNSRMDSIQAAVLKSKLKHLDTWQKTRMRNANLLRSLLSSAKIQMQTEVRLPDRHGNHLFPIFLSGRDALYEYMRSIGIQAAIQYPKTISEIVSCGDNLPKSQYYANHNLSLPIGEHLKESDIEQVAKAVNDFVTL
jgi:dTDP-4-amino-4,6-dideoxygalactose transaminase